MKFEQGQNGTWLLVDESAPTGANLIASAGSLVEILALKRLCEVRLLAPNSFGSFDFDHNGRAYRVTPFSDRSGRLSLRIDGSDGSISRLETEFVFPNG